MGRYDSHKFPFHYQMNSWANKRINTRLEREAKSIPCHVVKVEKDFIQVAFETANGIFTPPTVKIPQSWSQYSREPTQVKDKGYAVPGNYYLGGATGDAGGNTDFYPRGNLTTLSFNGVSHTQNPDRDYDQLTHMAGPTGWTVNSFQQQQQDQQQQQQNGQQQSPATSNLRARNIAVQRSMMAKARGVSVQRLFAPTVAASTSASSSSSSSNGQQQQQNQDKTNFSFDKNKLCTMQSVDSDHNITVDQQNKKITLKIPVGEWGYAGGDGQEGQYARIMTEQGPSVNFKARIG